MRWLLFLSRVGALSGIMTLLAFSLLLFNWNGDEVMSSTIITAGYGLSLVVIPLINLLYLIIFLFRKKLFGHTPVWLIGFNLICFVILLLF